MELKRDSAFSNKIFASNSIAGVAGMATAEKEWSIFRKMLSFHLKGEGTKKTDKLNAEINLEMQEINGEFWIQTERGDKIWISTSDDLNIIENSEENLFSERVNLSNSSVKVGNYIFIKSNIGTLIKGKVSLVYLNSKRLIAKLILTEISVLK